MRKENEMVGQVNRGNAVEANPMAKAVDDFLVYLAERGASSNTIAAYRNDLNQLSGFSDFNEANENHAAPDRSTLDKFIVGLKGRGYRDASIARKLAAARSFFVFLAADGTIGSNPMDGVRVPSVARMLARPISAQEVDKLLAQPAGRSTPGAKRDRAMLELLYATGMRVSELVALDVSDVDLKGSDARVRCQGSHGDERTIVIADRARAALLEYVDSGRPRMLRDSEEKALFLNVRGGRLTRQGLWVILKGYTKAAGLAVDISPHTLRHTFAAHMLGGGMPLSTVQQMLGHNALPGARISSAFSNQPGG